MKEPGFCGQFVVLVIFFQVYWSVCLCLWEYRDSVFAEATRGQCGFPNSRKHLFLMFAIFTSRIQEKKSSEQLSEIATLGGE